MVSFKKGSSYGTFILGIELLKVSQSIKLYQLPNAVTLISATLLNKV